MNLNVILYGEYAGSFESINFSGLPQCTQSTSTSNYAAAELEISPSFSKDTTSAQCTPDNQEVSIPSLLFISSYYLRLNSITLLILLISLLLPSFLLSFFLSFLHAILKDEDKKKASVNVAAIIAPVVIGVVVVVLVVLGSVYWFKFRASHKKERKIEMDPVNDIDLEKIK